SGAKWISTIFPAGRMLQAVGFLSSMFDCELK
ncbi:hypothetical protein P3T33_005271, partial [Rhizobium sp. AN67]|nr:hypothetical protein [Rhizobium sp. AN67]